MVNFDLDELVSGLVLAEGEGDGDVREIFGQFACRKTRVSAVTTSSFSIGPWALLPLGPSTLMIRERI